MKQESHLEIQETFDFDFHGSNLSYSNESEFRFRSKSDVHRETEGRSQRESRLESDRKYRYEAQLKSQFDSHFENKSDSQSDSKNESPLSASEKSKVQKLDDLNLIQSTHLMIRKEREVTLDVLRHLYEIERRKLFLKRGFPSLFAMCTEEFGYSAAAAQRRIDSMRLLKEIPEAAAKVQDGSLNLSSLSQAQAFFRLEKKEDRVVTRKEKLEILTSVQHKSSREVEREFAKRNPNFIRRESVRAVGEDRVRLSLSLKEETDQKLQKLKAILSHSNPSMTYEELIERLVEIGLDKLDPERKAVRALRRGSIPTLQPFLVPAPEVKLPTKNRTRRIPNSVSHQVWLKTKSQGCSYEDPSTGRVCGSKHFLQLDHIHEFARGGSHLPSNLRLLCGSHNRLRNFVV